MTIEWNVIATITAPVVTLFIGILINRYSDGRKTLISYFGHVSVFQLSLPEGGYVQVNTHAVVIRNTSRLRSTTNVRVSHYKPLKNFYIFPSINYREEILSDDTMDIVIPTLVPG